jgi:hypothetical protein
MKRLNKDHFCINVVKRCEDSISLLTPLHINEALGGIANLYLSLLYEKGGSKISVLTDHTFASEHIRPEDIAEEIKLCTGFNKEETIFIYNNMQEVFKETLIDVIYPLLAEAVLFLPLGLFKIKDINSSSFHFDYFDPEAMNRTHLKIENIIDDFEPDPEPHPFEI